jgi:hypothetical protein
MNHKKPNNPARYRTRFMVTCLTSAPILFCFALRGWRGKVLDLKPVLGTARAISRANALRHNAFTAELASRISNRSGPGFITNPSNRSGNRRVKRSFTLDNMIANDNGDPLPYPDEW